MLFFSYHYCRNEIVIYIEYIHMVYFVFWGKSVTFLLLAQEIKDIFKST